MYGITERQFRRYVAEATRRTGVTGEELLRQLETRLDAVVLRLGWALTMRQARQLVSHGHVLLEGRRVNIPSARVRPGQSVELADRARSFIGVREGLALGPDVPPYLVREGDTRGRLERLPERSEIPLPADVDDRLIVEYYS